MPTYRVKHDFNKSQPRWGGSQKALFGERNEGFVIEGSSAKAAFEAWNSAQLPGKQLNPFYLSITEEKPVRVKNPRELTIHDTELDTWFERDRAHVDLKNKATGETIIEWWDESVGEAVEDGFLDPRDYHGSAFDYAKSLGLLKPKRARKPRKSRQAFGSLVGKNPRHVRGRRRVVARKRNPQIEVTELVLYAENTGPGSRHPHEAALWNQRVSIIANLKRKVKKGVYDPALAAKLWGYWADSAAKAYNVIHGTGKYALTGSPFSATDRRAAAKIFEANFRDEVHEGMQANPRKRKLRNETARAERATMTAARMRGARGKPRHAQYVIAIRRTTGAIQFYTGAGFGPRSQAAHFMNTDTAQQVAGNLQYKSVIAPYSTPEKTIRAALLGKQ